MCYNGLNNMFFPLCQINDNHSVTSPSHTKKTKSDNYRKHHKSTLIDNKALSLFKMDDHEKVIGLIQKMKRIYDSLPSGKITKETDRKTWHFAATFWHDGFRCARILSFGRPLSRATRRCCGTTMQPGSISGTLPALIITR